MAARQDGSVSKAATAVDIRKTPAPTNTPAPTSTPTRSPQKYKDEAIVLDVRELTQNTEKYLNNVVSYSGKIAQVLETDVWFSERVIYTIRLAVDADLDNVVIAKLENDTGNGFRPLEDDVVSIWGIVTGRETFKTVF